MLQAASKQNIPDVVPEIIISAVYCHALQGPGQERDDIQELEDLWLSAQGGKRGQGAVHHQTEGTAHFCTAFHYKDALVIMYHALQIASVIA